MKKIMFNDKYGLTQAVLNGDKTMTRRVIPPIEVDWNRRGIVTLPISSFKDGLLFMDTSSILPDFPEYLAPAKYQPKYKVGEVVAVAQAYDDIVSTELYADELLVDKMHLEDTPGWNNKMFVRADLMPHQIRITNVRVERLQDISDEDCAREGIYKDNPRPGFYFNGYAFEVSKDQHGDVLAARWFKTPREAFAYLIDKVSGKGTWERNPWVYVYEFELVKEE